MSANEQVAFPEVIFLGLFILYIVATWMLTGSPYGFVIWPFCDVLGLEGFELCT